MILINNQKLYKEFTYATESELENEVVKYSKQLFGEKTIYINVKKKLAGKSLGNTIPDGFLFDFSDTSAPAFYLVEVELAKHDFYRHIFPQITKFISFFKNNNSQSELIEKIHEFLMEDADLTKRFRELSNSKEPYKTIKDIVEDAQNILIIIDEDKNELKEIMDVYVDTWGKMVKTLIFKRFLSGDEIIYSVNPEFNDIEFSALEYTSGTTEIKNTVTEDFHFEKVNADIKSIYATIKQSLINWDAEVGFNPQKYYISILYNRNVAYFITRKSKLRLIIKASFETVSNLISYHKINSFSTSVQKFWGGDSCEVVIENNQHLDEIINLIIKLLEEDKVNE